MRNGIFCLVASFLLALAGCKPAGRTFEIEDGHFQLDGKKVQLICGEMHYPRIPREYWRDRLQRARAMGLNTVSAYVFWNYHERQPGVFDFEGQADIAEFVRLAREEGLWVILRPGPYVCAEWDFGGYPYWLQKDKEMVWRSDNPQFLEACRRYITRLGKELAPLTVTNGGNILMVQVENEYGSYASDTVYLGKLRDMIREAGFNVPLMTCDGAGQMAAGHLDGVFPSVNGAVGEDIFETVDKYQPGGPYFVAEFYPAWFDVWGKRHSYRDYKRPAEQLDWMLKNDVSVSIYMFHGGTNFEYTNGANTSYGYEPQPTSYDYDAPLGEYGNAYPKYYAFREVIRKYLPEGDTLPAVPAPNPVVSFPEIRLGETAPLEAAFTRRIPSDSVLTMEDVDQDFGYIHYETTLDKAGKGVLVLKDVRDYAVVTIDGKQVGSLDRRHRQNKLEIEVEKAPARLEIVVENVGRVNYGPDILHNRKGITERVTWNGEELRGWTVSPLPLYRADMKAFAWKKEEGGGRPAFYRGTFTVRGKGDTFIDMSGWGKGAVWVNGRSIGKFWQIGPQQTLYMPGPWLREGDNEIVVFEMEDTGCRTLRGLDKPVLDSLGIDKNALAKAAARASGKPALDAGDRIYSGKLEQKDGWQEFVFDRPATMRHLCFESLSSYDGTYSCIAEIDLLDESGRPMEKDAWQVVYANTEQAVTGDADLLIDDNANTSWHSQWQGEKTPFPHRVIIDLGEILPVKGIRIRQRSPEQPGCVKDFRLYGRPQFFLFK